MPSKPANEKPTSSEETSSKSKKSEKHEKSESTEEKSEKSKSKSKSHDDEKADKSKAKSKKTEVEKSDDEEEKSSKSDKKSKDTTDKKAKKSKSKETAKDSKSKSAKDSKSKSAKDSKSKDGKSKTKSDDKKAKTDSEKTPKKTKDKRSVSSPPQSTGSIIPPVRVVRVLSYGLNPVLSRARDLLHEAEYPASEKKENGSVSVPNKTPLASITDTSTGPDRINFQAELAKAEAAHRESLRRQYERERLASLSDKKSPRYNPAERDRINAALREAKSKHAHANLAKRAEVFINGMSGSVRADYYSSLELEAKAQHFLDNFGTRAHPKGSAADRERAQREGLEAYERAKKAAKEKVKDARTFNLQVFNRSFDANFYSANVGASYLNATQLERFNRKFNSQFYSDSSVGNDPFNLRTFFEATCGSTFYDDFKSYPDPLSRKSRAKTSNDEWSRARALITKLCNRVSADAQSLVPIFLDYVIEQVARNAIYNCVEAGASIIKLSHAIDSSNNPDGDDHSTFVKRVPLHRLLGTLDEFEFGRAAHAKIQDILAKYARDRKKASDTEKPVLPKYRLEHDVKRRSFSTYVCEICRHVKHSMITEENSRNSNHKRDYSKVSVSSEFKEFCTDIIYSLIRRISSMLIVTLNARGLRTVTVDMMREVIENMHCITGTEVKGTLEIVSQRLAQYLRSCENRKRDAAAHRARPDPEGSRVVESDEPEESEESDDDSVEDA